MKSLVKCIGILCCVYLLFVIISCSIEPIIAKRTGNKEANPIQSPAIQSTDANERIRCIDDNSEALAWRLRLIESAEEEIILSTFDFRDDNSSMDIMAALSNAASRGVKVRVLVDGAYGTLRFGTSEKLKDFAGLDNIEVKLYNPINFLKPWTANYRLHDKYLIIDDFAYILGGRNTCDLFLGDYLEHYNIDRDVLVYEPEPGSQNSLGTLREYFESVWSLEVCRNVTGNQSETAVTEYLQHYESLRENDPSAFEPVDWNGETICANSVVLLNNGIEAEYKYPVLWNQLMQLMAQASDIIVQTPYIICDDEMYSDLADVCSSGEIQMITNAVESGANPFGCTDFMNQKNNILNTGVQISAALYGQSLHTKTVLIDDSTSVIGSFNFDMRSAYLDTELMLLIDCPELNASLREQAAELVDCSMTMLPDGTQIPGSEYKPVELSGSQKVYYACMRLFTMVFRHLL